MASGRDAFGHLTETAYEWPAPVAGAPCTCGLSYVSSGCRAPSVGVLRDDRLAPGISERPVYHAVCEAHLLAFRSGQWRLGDFSELTFGEVPAECRAVVEIRVR